MLDETTDYSINSESNEKSTIRLLKLTADVLQKHLPDVHGWIQCVYDSVLEEMPHKSRRRRGNIVRFLADREAQKYPLYYELIDEYL